MTRAGKRTTSSAMNWAQESGNAGGGVSFLAFRILRRGQVIGYALAHQGRPPQESILRFEELYVRPCYRGIVGPKLMNAMLSTARSSGLTHCELRPVANEKKLKSLVKLYTRKGFRPFGKD